MKGPAYYLFLSGHCCQRFEMFVPQFGVRMVKAKKKPACFTRTGIQLRPARRPLTSDQTDLAAMLQFSQYLGGFDRGHHPFGSPRVERDAIYQLATRLSSPHTGTTRLISGRIKGSFYRQSEQQRRRIWQVHSAA